MLSVSCGLMFDASASQPPADVLGGLTVEPVQLGSSSRSLKTCNRSVLLSVGDRSIVGWVGGELVSMVKRGMQFFGTHQDQPVRLKMVGSQDGGYWVRGLMAGEQVDWKIEGDVISGELNSCDK